MLMIAAFGVGLQFPVLLVFLQLVGVLTPQTAAAAAGGTRCSAIVVLAAVITPSGDPISLARARRPDDRPLLPVDPASAGSSSAAGASSRAAAVVLSDRRRRIVRPTAPSCSPRYAFPLDRFQLEAIDALDAGATSSSRRRPAAARRSSPSTASRSARRDGRRAFYTAPIKALSNQKFRDLVERYGAERGRAADRRQRDQRRRAGRRDDDRGAAQHDLRPVARPRRPRRRRARRGALPPGHLPRPGVGGGDHPPAAARAAGVPVGDGQQHRRAGRRGSRPCAARPTPWSRSAVRCSSTTSTSSATARTTGCTAADVRRRPAQPRRGPPRRVAPCAAAAAARRARPARGAAGGSSTRRAGSRPSSCSTSARLLPAIYFIFSRNQCDEAARACLDAGLRLTTATSATRIREIVDARLRGPRRRRPRGARLRPVRRPARGRHRRPPRRHGAAVQGGRRGVLHRGAGQGRVRHRDAGRRRSTCRPAPSSSRS